MELVLTDRIVDLVDNGFDAAIRVGQLEDSSLLARRLASSSIITCAAPEYLARRGVLITPSSLPDIIPCLMPIFFKTTRHLALSTRRCNYQRARERRPAGQQRIDGASLPGQRRGHRAMPGIRGAGRSRGRTLTPLLEEFSGYDLGVYAVYPAYPPRAEPGAGVGRFPGGLPGRRIVTTRRPGTYFSGSSTTTGITPVFLAW